MSSLTAKKMEEEESFKEATGFLLEQKEPDEPCEEMLRNLERTTEGEKEVLREGSVAVADAGDEAIVT